MISSFVHLKKSEFSQVSKCAFIISQCRGAWLARCLRKASIVWREWDRDCVCGTLWFSRGFISSSKPAYDVGWTDIINAFCKWGNRICPWFSRLAWDHTALPRAVKTPGILHPFDITNNPVGYLVWESPLTFSWGRGFWKGPLLCNGSTQIHLHSPFL